MTTDEPLDSRMEKVASTAPQRSRMDPGCGRRRVARARAKRARSCALAL